MRWIKRFFRNPPADAFHPYWQMRRERPAGRTPLSQVPFWVIDLELTGLDPATDRILSICAVPVRNSRIALDRVFSVQLAQTFYRPESIAIHEILPEQGAVATANHGIPGSCTEPELPGRTHEPELPDRIPEQELSGRISKQELSGRVPEQELSGRIPEPELPGRIHEPELSGRIPEQEALRQFLLTTAGGVWVAHFGLIDRLMLEQTARRHGLHHLHQPMIDTADLIPRALDAYKEPGSNNSGRMQLARVCRDLDVPADDLHTAEGDAMATALLFVRLLHQMQRRGVQTLKELMRSRRGL